MTLGRAACMGWAGVWGRGKGQERAVVLHREQSETIYLWPRFKSLPRGETLLSGESIQQGHNISYEQKE